MHKGWVQHEEKLAGAGAAATVSRRQRFQRLPAELIDTWKLADGTRLIWRPVRHSDHALLGQFLAGLSRRTRFERFQGALNQPTPTLLAEMTQVDFRNHHAFIATHLRGDAEIMVADARFVVDADADAGDFALVVTDAWQGRGVGAHLLHLLAEAAARRGLRWLRGDVRDDNERMLSLMKRCGFFRAPHPHDDALVQGVKLLLPPYPLSPYVDSAFLADLPDAPPERC
jgi:acetyltransferase